MRVRSNGGIIGPQNNKAKFVYAGDAGLLTSITAVKICNSSYDNLDETVISTSGGYIRLIGVGFSSGYSLYVNGVYISSTQLVSSTEITAVIPANGNGTYSLTLFNSSGSGAIWAAGLTFSGFPSWTTGTYINSGTSVSVQLLATGDAPLTYSLQAGSTLPSGVTLSSSGLLSGTITGISVNTVYTFTVLVDDAQLQTTQQAITLSVVVSDQYFNSTVLALHGDFLSTGSITTEYLAVAGGGGGGANSGGGGGAGGLLTGTVTVTANGTYTITVGTGGSAGTTVAASGIGANSVFSSFTAIGGGGGATRSGGGSVAGPTIGGSGGGGDCNSYLTGAAGTTGQGNSGGSNAGMPVGGKYAGSGGGGAGAAGTGANTSTGASGNGGNGLSVSITGSAITYAGGGVGGADPSRGGVWGTPGTGGGGGPTGTGTTATAGIAGTNGLGGGGGSGGNSAIGAAGGSGVVIIAYPTNYPALTVGSGLTYTVSSVTRSGYYVYTFTAGTGTISFAPNNNIFLDSSNNNFTITRTGTPTQGTFTPFSQTGWSGYFPGGSNYLTSSGSTAFVFGTGDFTVEYWVNYSTIYSTYNALCGNAATGNGFGFGLADAAGHLYLTTSSNGYPSAGTGLVVNQWYHVAFVRISGTVKFYLNGILNNTVSVATNITETNFAIGNNIAGSFPSNASVSNLRVVVGTGIYTAAFTPSIAPLTAISGTSLLTLQSNRFKDNSTNNFTLTPTGTPKIQALSPFAPSAVYNAATVGGSVYFTDNTTVLGSTSTTIQQFAAGDFTVEMWAYFITIPGGAPELFNAGNFHLNFRSSPNLAITNDASVLSNTSNTIYAGVWTHIAAVRASGTMTIYINGVANTPATGQTYSFSQGAISIGSGSSGFNGYISGLRVLNGTALYTTAFTPPTAPLTAVTNTSLLLNGTNAAIYDQTAKNDLITVGSVQTSNTQSKFGGSAMFFNGTTDYLTAVDTPNLQLGTGDFTIEAWVYITTAGTGRGFISKGPVAATTGWECRFNSSNFFRFEWTASFLVGTTTITSNTWVHVAVVRSGSATGNIKTYVNGTLDATSGVAVTDNFIQTDPLRIGIDRAGTAFFPGYVDDLRITKYARYTANFTPATSTFSDQ